MVHGQVMLKYFSMECVAKELELSVDALKSVPVASRKNFQVCPWMLDFSETSKFDGMGRFPSTLQFRAHFPSIVNQNYQGERESLEVKFTKCDPKVQGVVPFTIGYVDGQNKGLIVQSIFGLLDRCVCASIFGFVLFALSLSHSQGHRGGGLAG